MPEFTNKEREQVVRTEIKNMHSKEFLTTEEYEQWIIKYDQYVRSENEVIALESSKKKKEQLSPQKKAKQKPVKKKKVLTADQIRERNITWSLILGVVFLLIGGLFVATSNWEQMADGLKVFSISFIALFFLGLSVVSSKLLKIHKTAFAFLTLGSLFIPIVILAIGYFKLIGNYLALTGEGKYLLGLIGTLLPLPLYVRNAYQHKSRLFIWISYLFLTLAVGFALAATQIPVDGFYLGIVVFNALLLYGYYKFSSNQKLALFMKELPTYSQLNLVISTLLMLFVFKNEVFYSFNILLTASIYMAMVFVYQTKSYQLVFSAMLAYGVYQLVDHTPLANLDLVIYACMGMVYLGFAFAAKNHDIIQKIFRYTSGVISFFAFIYISYEGIIVRAGESSSVLLLIGYLVVAANYIYLAYLTNHIVFKFLAPTFILVAGYQLWDVVNVSRMELYMFLLSLVMFTALGLFNKNRFFVPIRLSTRYVTLFAMFLAMVDSFLIEEYSQLSLMLGLTGALCYLIYKKIQHKDVTEVAQWGHAISWFLGLLVIYPKMVQLNTSYDEMFNWAAHFGVTGIILLIVSFAWYKGKENQLANAAFFVGQSAFTIGLLLLMSDFSTNNDFVRMFMLLIGIGIYVLLVKKTKVNGLWIFVSLTTLAWYSSLMPLFEIIQEDQVYFLLFAPVLLLLIENLLGRKDKSLKPYFFWLAHGVQPLLIIIAVFISLFSGLNPLILLIPLVVYVYSSLRKKEVEWQVKTFLYAAFTMIPVVIGLVWNDYNLTKYIDEDYVWLLASGIMLIIWLAVPADWRARVDWYIIPFSTLGLYTIVFDKFHYSFFDILLLFGYVILTLYLYHHRKWFVWTLLPLLATLILWGNQDYFQSDTQLIAIGVINFFLLLVIGRIFYSGFYLWSKEKKFIDWYSSTAVIYLGFAASFLDYKSSVWLEVLLLVLLTLWLFYHVKRFKEILVQRIFLTVGAISMLGPYYLLLDEYKAWIPHLLMSEVEMLPWLILSIILSLTTWKKYKQIMSYVQLGVLLIVTATIVIDAIQSNTIYDAIIVGSLSLASLIAGMQFRIKSYFFVGAGVLIFNVILQTKPYWGNMPWWGYLLIAGFTLIGIASFNEWQKQKTPKDEPTYFQRKYKQITQTLKKWD